MKNPAGQYFEQMGMPPLTVPFNSYNPNYPSQHPMQVQVSSPIPTRPVVPHGLSPVSLGYSTNCFGSYPYPGEFNSARLNPIPVYHPDTVSCNDHRQCRQYSQRDGFHCAYMSPAGPERSPEPVYINNNTPAVPMPPGFHPNRYNGQQALQAVDFLPVADEADQILTSPMPFKFAAGQSPGVMRFHEKSQMTNFPGKFPIVSPQPANINNTQPVPPTFHPSQLSGQEAMQEQADFLPVTNAADLKSTLSPIPFGFGTAEPPRVMVFHEKSPMANFLGKFPPGDYVMEIRVIPNNSDKNKTSNSGSSDDEFEGDSVNGDEGKERMKLIIM